MNKSEALNKLGQSLWYDNIDRGLIESGWLKAQVGAGVFYGLTSNPSIFKKAISESHTYTTDIQAMSFAGYDEKQIYERLAIADIKKAADILLPIYEESGKTDGYVSLEVDPDLAHDHEKTVSEAKRLWGLVNKKNLMIKVPATRAGIFAIRDLIAAGLNINVTLIFSIERYLEVINAYYEGLEQRISEKQPISDIHSVASFFVSRLDVMFEDKIKQADSAGTKATDLIGKLGIINALAAYEAFVSSIEGERFGNIREAGGNVQRPLWASTGTKNPDFSDVLYVDSLVLPDTVNTAPPKTIEAYMDHGRTQIVDYANAKETLGEAIGNLEDVGINFPEMMEELEAEGVEKFQKAQNGLLAAVKEKSASFSRRLGDLKGDTIRMLEKMGAADFRERFFAPDATLFTSRKEEEAEVLNRLGWIDAPRTSRDLIDSGIALRDAVLSDGYTDAVVLGMGGSSLAPEVFSKVFGANEKAEGLNLSILDSTDPIQIQAKLDSLNLKRTLFIVSSKSGSTAEMKTTFAFFWSAFEKKGIENIGSHFIAITDPNSALEKTGRENDFRTVINADPSVGGRFSSLIAFGLIPAILAGIDGEKLLENAELMREKCDEADRVKENPGFVLGAILAAGHEQGLDKVTIVADAKYSSVGSWLEQLIAESSGKDGKGLIPIDNEPRPANGKYSPDRVFYYISSGGSHDEEMEKLVENRVPVITSSLPDAYALAGEMYKWEMAISCACALMGVNPFNQPNVQSSKTITNDVIAAYKTDPNLDHGNVLFETESVQITGMLHPASEYKNIGDLIKDFLSVNEGDFIGINAFLPRLQPYEEKLQQLRSYLLDTYGVPVSLGFGPRFLHSTGQLIKGGKNNGYFIILSQAPDTDLEIPGEEMNFSVLHLAQALGDMRALQEKDRPVIHIRLKKCCFPAYDIVGEIK